MIEETVRCGIVHGRCKAVYGSAVKRYGSVRNNVTTTIEDTAETKLFCSGERFSLAIVGNNAGEIFFNSIMVIINGKASQNS